MDAPAAGSIIALYGLSNAILATSIGDLSDRDAKERSRGGTGPSIAWTIGHLCHHKIQVLKLLGDDQDNPFASMFDERGATDGSDYMPLKELSARFAALNTEVCAALASSAARLERPMPGAGPHSEKPLVDTLLFLAWHEAYHIGGIGAIRREMGRPAISEMVRGRSQAVGREGHR
jgi:uncharacterized damage-inducible protein DinB